MDAISFEDVAGFIPSISSLLRLLASRHHSNSITPLFIAFCIGPIFYIFTFNPFLLIISYWHPKMVINENVRTNGGGYTKLLDIPAGVDDSKYPCIDVICCYRRPWKFKLLLILGVAILISWFAYHSLIGTLNFGKQQSIIVSTNQNQRQSSSTDQNPFTYGKSDAGFYNSTIVTDVPIPKAEKVVVVAGGAVKKKFITECKLPRVDPWDPALQPYLDPTYYMNWKRDCKRETPELTTLFNGYVVVNAEAKSNGIYCQFKCLYPHTDYDFVEGAWKEVNEEPDCDIVETQCRNENSEDKAFDYSYVHAQIYRRPEYKQERTWLKPLTATPRPDIVDIDRTPDFGPDNGKGKRRAPDVHVFVIDSLSHTQMLRTMTKTVTWLRERMGAIAFPHHNKNGLNSRPNGYAMFLGIQAYPVEENPMGEGYTPPRDLSAMGGIYLDKEPFVGFEYREKNYRTMMAEDWARGVFNWPSNYGFINTPVDHYMRPFQIRVEANKNFTKIIQDKSCREPHELIMQYLMDYIDTYEEQSKFSISWMSEIAHYNTNGPYRMDEDVYKFLRDYEKKLNNSFLFIMGDHGLRFGGIRYTKQGEIEDNNPAMFMTLPEHLRYNNRLVDNLRQNARQLTTHFDIHATLVNIAREGDKMSVNSEFDKLAPELKGPTPFGQSLLYPFDKNTPRNCATLKIPFEFCQCQFDTRNVTETETTLAKKLAHKMIERMNSDLVGKKADEKCVQLELSKQTVEIIEFEPAQNFGLFKLTYETIPGNGKFWGYMKVHDRGLASQNFTYISTRFSRLNEYAEQSYCTDDFAIAPYCYCKELLTATTTIAPST